MTKTRNRTRKMERVEDLDEQIEAMETELAEGYEKPLTWEEVTSTTAEEIARKEQRRGILPRLIHAAKVRRLELEKLRREEEAAPLREKVGRPTKRSRSKRTNCARPKRNATPHTRNGP